MQNFKKPFSEKKENSIIDDILLECFNLEDLNKFFKGEGYEELRNKISEHFSKNNDEISSKLMQKNLNQLIFSSGSKKLDSLFNLNGIATGEIALLYGKSNTGKTQISHQLCINCYNSFLNQKGSVYDSVSLPTFKNLVLYIDSENTFRPERIKQMSYPLNLMGDGVIESISILKVSSLSKLEMSVKKLSEVLSENEVKLIVIDSLTHFFSLEISNKIQDSSIDEVWEIMKILIKLLRLLKKYAEKYGVAIICTSQVRSSISKERFFDVVPVLGSRIDRFIKQWILLGQYSDSSHNEDDKSRRFAHLINSQIKKEEIIHYQITMDGIKDSYL